MRRDKKWEEECARRESNLGGSDGDEAHDGGSDAVEEVTDGLDVDDALEEVVADDGEGEGGQEHADGHENGTEDATTQETDKGREHDEGGGDDLERYDDEV